MLWEIWPRPPRSPPRRHRGSSRGRGSARPARPGSRPGRGPAAPAAPGRPARRRWARLPEHPGSARRLRRSPRTRRRGGRRARSRRPCRSASGHRSGRGSRRGTPRRAAPAPGQRGAREGGEGAGVRIGEGPSARSTAVRTPATVGATPPSGPPSKVGPIPDNLTGSACVRAGQSSRTFSADPAAFAPHMPWTPAPGGVAAEHRNTPGMPVQYGSRATRGRSTTCSGSLAPVAMSPPT